METSTQKLVQAFNAIQYFLFIYCLQVGFPNLVKKCMILSTYLYTYVSNILYKLYLHAYNTEYKISCKKFSRNFIIITYEFSNSTYKLLLPIKKVPSNILSVKSDGEDITSLFQPFLGPKGNFHGQSYTPSLLGFSDLEIIFLDDTVRTIQKDEVIQF
jgi:hypothetical protein